MIRGVNTLGEGVPFKQVLVVHFFFGEPKQSVFTDVASHTHTHTHTHTRAHTSANTIPEVGARGKGLVAGLTLGDAANALPKTAVMSTCWRLWTTAWRLL